VGQQGVLDWVKVREVTGVFGAWPAVHAAVNDLLIAGFDRADIETVAERPGSRERIGTPVPAIELADVPEAPRQEFVAPEDTAGVFAVCVSVSGALGAMIGAMIIIASGGTTPWTVLCAIIGGVVGSAIGYAIARALGWRWTPDPAAPAPVDGVVLWARVRTPEHEQKAIDIFKAHHAVGVRVHEMEIQKRLEDLPLSSLRPDPWLGNEPLAKP
jgi:hypothetical protein